MRIFVDTSAFLAVLDADEANHPAAAQVWEELLQGDARLFSTNYVLVETLALVQNRLGIPVVHAFQERISPLLRIAWVDEALHQSAVSALLAAGRRRLSLVDCASFEVARSYAVDAVFAFDVHFQEGGFKIIGPGQRP